MRRLLLFILMGITVEPANAQYERVDIPGSEKRTLYSAIVQQDYELHILLPGNYSSGNKRYPVVYLLDSQWDFPLLKSIYGQQYYDGFIPELIIVGITWGGKEANPDVLRTRDFTPTKETRLPLSGGADNFLSFFSKELFPFVENNYRADSSGRTLAGCSLGGLFTVYTLLTQPHLFRGYIAATPAIGWDREVLYQYEKKFSPSSPGEIRLYMTFGDVERSLPSFKKFSNQLVSRNHSFLEITSKVLENTGHSGTKSETYSRGLQFVFDRPKLELANPLLEKHTGRYGTAGQVYTVAIDNKQLEITMPDGGSRKLFAAGENEFYAVSEFFNVRFIKSGEKKGMEIYRYGSKNFYDKME